MLPYGIVTISYIYIHIYIINESFHTNFFDQFLNHYTLPCYRMESLQSDIYTFFFFINESCHKNILDQILNRYTLPCWGMESIPRIVTIVTIRYLRSYVT